jgi:hypothetical protein
MTHHANDRKSHCWRTIEIRFESLMKVQSSLIIVLLTSIVAGCSSEGDGLPREAIEVEAKIDSKPLERAFVQFVPVNSAGEATHVGGILENGQLSITKEQGPVPGDYLVSITSGVIESNVDKNALPGEGTKPRKDTIPAKYNLNTELKATVSKGGPNVFAFELSSK